MRLLLENCKKEVQSAIIGALQMIKGVVATNALQKEKKEAVEGKKEAVEAIASMLTNEDKIIHTAAVKALVKMMRLGESLPLHCG